MLKFKKDYFIFFFSFFHFEQVSSPSVLSIICLALFISSLHHTCFLNRGRSLWFGYKTKATGPSCFCFVMSPKSQFITFKGFVWNNWSIDHFPWNPPLWRHVVYMFLLFLRQTFWHWLILFSIICLNYINHNLIKWFHSLNHVKIKQYSIYLILWRV